MTRVMDRRKRKKYWLIPVVIIAVLVVVSAVYVSDYYKADETATAALRSDDAVAVSQTEYGWLFDGPSDDTALIYYPGGKVEETAYAPFLHRLAADGADVFLVKMPFRLAVFGKDKADQIIEENGYETWYIGGHSLGGVMAANYASEHGDLLDGVVLCAAYPIRELDEDLTEVLVYGSEDHVLNAEKIKEGEQYAPADLTEHVIEGGNHAQFGNYGEQKGDGAAGISAKAQQEEAVRVITDAMK